MDNKNNLIVSASIAFGLYFFFLFLLFNYSTNHNVKKIDAFKKTTVLQLDIILETPKEEIKESLVQKQTSITKRASKVVKKSTSKVVKKKSNLKSLFANVKTKAKKVSTKKVSTVKQNSVSSRFKSKFEKERKVDSLKISELNNKKRTSNNKNIATQSKNENDPYFSKIYQILSSRWKPTIFYNDLSAKVLVSISTNGRFSYQFVQFSNNIGFDEQLKSFLNEEMLKSYPISPQNKLIKLEILFQSKG